MSEDDKNEMSSKTTEQTTMSGIVFQQLLYKFQHVNKNDDNFRDRIRHLIPLCSELIDNVQKTTAADFDDIQRCFELLIQVFSASRLSTLVDNDHLFAREIFFAMLDVIVKSEICRYLNDDQHSTVMQETVYKSLVNVFLHYAATTIEFVPFKNDDLAVRKYTETFIAMHKRVERYLQSQSGTKEPTNYTDQTESFILSFFLNISDRTVLVPWLLGIGLVKSMLECLKVKALPLSIVKKLSHIIHNISRHEDGADELNKFNGLLILNDFQSRDAQILDDNSSLTISMAIALLSTPEQIRSDNKRMNKVLNQLLQITIKAAEVSFTSNSHHDSSIYL
jgi:hypothetical protein